MVKTNKTNVSVSLALVVGDTILRIDQREWFSNMPPQIGNYWREKGAMGNETGNERQSHQRFTETKSTDSIFFQFDPGEHRTTKWHLLHLAVPALILARLFW